MTGRLFRRFILILIFISGLCFALSEVWLHNSDQYHVLENKIATFYLLKSLLPNRDYIQLESGEVKVPNGFVKVSEDCVMGLSRNPGSSLSRDLTLNYGRFDSFGHVKYWTDWENGKTIRLADKKFGSIRYFFLYEKDQPASEEI